MASGVLLVVSWGNRRKGGQASHFQRVFLSFSCRPAKHHYMILSNFQEEHQHIRTFQASACFTFAIITWPGTVSMWGNEQWQTPQEQTNLCHYCNCLVQSQRKSVGCRNHRIWMLAPQPWVNSRPHLTRPQLSVSRMATYTRTVTAICCTGLRSEAHSAHQVEKWQANKQPVAWRGLSRLPLFHDHIQQGLSCGWLYRHGKCPLLTASYPVSLTWQPGLHHHHHHLIWIFFCYTYALFMWPQ